MQRDIVLISKLEYRTHQLGDHCCQVKLTFGIRQNLPT